MNLKTKEEKLALLEETINFYNLGNRCTDGEVCRYYMEGNDGCAVGRLIENKELCKQLDEMGIANGVTCVEVFSQLPESVRSYGQDFLYELQSLHDRQDNWNASGLSSVGLNRAEEIRIKLEAGKL